MSNYKTLPDTGFVRLNSIIAPSGPIPVSKSTWWQGVKDGRFPKPVKLGVKTTAWRVEDIRDLIEAWDAKLHGEPTTLDAAGQAPAHIQRQGGGQGNRCNSRHRPALAQERAAPSRELLPDDHSRRRSDRLPEAAQHRPEATLRPWLALLPALQDAAAAGL